MKAKERQQLKENEFARSVEHAVAAVGLHGRTLVLGLVAAVVLVGLLGSVMWWRSSQAERAGAMLGVAFATAEATVAPASTLGQAANTFPTPIARAEAALKAFQDVATAYPSSDAAVAANYEAAGQLLVLGRAGEAEALYERVTQSGSPLYAPVARMGLAQAKLSAGKTDEAVRLYTDLSGERDGALPIDGVLMQLASAYVKAGKSADAKASYKRVVDEFATSPYVAEARQRLAALN